MDTRSMPVPEGLAGMRVDAGLARLLGRARPAAAALAEEGGVDLDGSPVGKSDRLMPGAWLEVRLPEASAAPETTPVDIEGMTILYSDDDIVAVDKPAGVAAHATVGWHGPTVLGGLAAAGFRITTSGIHQRQGIRHRPRLGHPRAAGHRAPARRRHLGCDGRGALRARLHPAQASLQTAHRREALSRACAGTPGSVQRHHRRAHRKTPRTRLEIRRHPRWQEQR